MGQTVLICRPHQLREAAIVLSCISGPNTLLSVLEQPPLTRQQYDDLYTEFTEARQASMKNVIGFQYRGVDADTSEIKAAANKHELLRRRLAEPRSWLTHNARWAELLHAVPPERAVFLFPATSDDLHIWPSAKARNVFVDRSAENVEEFAEKSLLPAVTDVMTFECLDNLGSAKLPGASYRYKDLDDLAKVAWQVFRSSEQPPEPELANASDVAAILTGLNSALERKAPLRILEAPHLVPTKATHAAFGPSDAEECVMIEAIDSASVLCGLLYARHRFFRAFICPVPDLPLVEDAIGEFRKSQQQALHAKRAFFPDGVEASPEVVAQMASDVLVAEPSEANSAPRVLKERFLRELFNKYVLGDWRGDALSKIERAVCSRLPIEVVCGIGQRPVTVFTIGIPYTFVHLAGHKWSQKAIGHIVSDAPLIVATDMGLSTKQASIAPYAAIFDPGFFDTTETRDVMASLRSRRMHSLVFTRNASQLEALIFATQLPLDLVFFNTHGTDDGIVLGNFAVNKEDLVQWIKFPSTPIIFNNSCISWQGVGREFIRAGARGYIGTLWPVSAKGAAILAADSMKLLVDGKSIASAIRHPSINEETMMAYIYIGTAGSKALWRNNTGDGLAKDFVLEGASQLLQALQTQGPQLRMEYERPLLRFVYAELESFFRRVNALDCTSTELFSLRSRQLLVLALIIFQLQVPREECEAIAEECFRLLGELRDTEPHDADHESIDREELLKARSEIRKYYGDIRGAIEDLEAADGLADPKDTHGLITKINLAELFKIDGQWERAFEIATQAKSQADQNNDREARMRLAGVLGQLERRKGNLDQALSHANEGMALAIELRNQTEQSEFKLDQARIFIRSGEADAAIAAIKEGGKIARANLDVQRDLASHGLMSQALLKKGQFDLARDTALNGLQMAASLHNVYEQAGFSLDIGAAEEASGNLPQAIQAYLQAIILATQCGRTEMLPGCSHVAELALQTKDWALIGVVMASLFEVLSLVVPEARVFIASELIKTAKHAVLFGPRQDALTILEDILKDAAAMIKAANGPALELAISAQVALMLHEWLLGKPGTTETARSLDQATSGIFALQSFVSVKPPDS